MGGHDNVVSLTDRRLGRCPLCERTVRFSDNFVRMDGAFVHLSCGIDPEHGERRPDGVHAVPPLESA